MRVCVRVGGGRDALIERPTAQHPYIHPHQIATTPQHRHGRPPPPNLGRAGADGRDGARGGDAAAALARGAVSWLPTIISPAPPQKKNIGNPKKKKSTHAYIHPLHHQHTHTPTHNNPPAYKGAGLGRVRPDAPGGLPREAPAPPGVARRSYLPADPGAYARADASEADSFLLSLSCDDPPCAVGWSAHKNELTRRNPPTPTQPHATPHKIKPHTQHPEPRRGDANGPPPLLSTRR